MFSTSEHLLELDSLLTRRLDRLSAFDPAAAAQIRQGLLAPEFQFKPALEPVEDQLCKQGVQAQPDVVILLGAAGEREMRFLFERIPEEAKVLLVEAQASAAAALFRAWPLEDYVRDGRLSLALGTQEAPVEAKAVALIDFQRPPEVRVLQMSENAPEAALFYKNAMARVIKSVHLNTFNLGTLVYRGPLWQFNTIKNLPRLVANPGIQRLQGAFAGRAAVVVGAGPSLNDALPYLAGAAGRCVLISTGTALRPLRRTGIRPDLVVSVDASHLTGKQFETACDDLFLACSSLAYPPILSQFRGLFSGSLAANPISEWLNTFGAPKGTITAAGTVTTSAIDLAIQMGCSTVICVGADLSFKDNGVTHADHSMYHGSRLDPARLIKVPGNHQPEVFTSEQFKCYIDLLEDYIKAHPETRFINATRSGARIQGMELADPSLLGRLEGKPFSAYDAIAELHASFDENAAEPLREQLAETVEQLREIMADAQSAAMFCNQLIMMLRMPRMDDEALARDYLNKLQQIDRRLTENRKCSIFLDMSLWPIGYQSGTRRAPHEEKYSEPLLANKRSRELYEQIAGAAKWTQQLLTDVIAQLNNSAKEAEPVSA